VTSAIAALVEAWSEVRVHKVRAVLSLFGVMLAVLAMTVITALGDMFRQANAEFAERTSGRPATLSVNAGSHTGPVNGEAIDAAFGEVVQRYRIRYASAVSYREQVFRFTEGPEWVETRVVDQPYGDMHRIEPVHGRWFAETDEQLYAPSIVVNEAFHARIGTLDMRTHPTIVLGGQRPVRTTVVGVVANEYPEAPPMAFMLESVTSRWAGVSDEMFGPPMLELWVPPELADELVDLVRRDVATTLGEGGYVDIFRQDASEFDEIDAQLAWIIRGVSAIALALASLGLVNIALVTVRYRIREIGIRRSFGATSGRIFFAVMMESVCATVVAGFIGVALAVAIVKNIPPHLLNVTDLPPFPARAAVEGMVAATLVGALAGLIPGNVAVRIKVIDAIRY
jgi:putative ABC transport system permease protein